MKHLLFAAMLVSVLATLVYSLPQLDEEDVSEEQSYLEGLLQSIDSEEQTGEVEDSDDDSDPPSDSTKAMSDDEIAMSEDSNAISEWNRGFRNTYYGFLNFVCNERNGEAINHIYSIFSAAHGDRRFKFSCIKVSSSPGRNCVWSPYLNIYGGPLARSCPADFYMTGVSSFHNKGKKDRIWRIRCCRSNGFKTESCELTKYYINRFQGVINYTAKLSGSTTCEREKTPSFFTGLFSYHENGKRKDDRRWKIYQCKAGKM